MNKLIISVILLSSFCLMNAGKPQECEVCEAVINKLSKMVPDDASAEEIESEFKNWCKTATGREEKFVSFNFKIVSSNIFSVNFYF